MILTGGEKTSPLKVPGRRDASRREGGLGEWGDMVSNTKRIKPTGNISPVTTLHHVTVIDGLAYDSLASPTDHPDPTWGVNRYRQTDLLTLSAIRIPRRAARVHHNRHLNRPAEFD